MAKLVILIFLRCILKEERNIGSYAKLVILDSIKSDSVKIEVH